MMLAEPDDIDAELVRQHRLAQGLVDDDTVARRIAAIGKQKIAELHAALRFVACHHDPAALTVSRDAATRLPYNPTDDPDSPPSWSAAGHCGRRLAGAGV